MTSTTKGGYAIMLKPRGWMKTEPTSNPTRLELKVMQRIYIQSACNTIINKRSNANCCSTSNWKDTSYTGSNAQQRIGLEGFLIQRESMR